MEPIFETAYDSYLNPDDACRQIIHKCVNGCMIRASKQINHSFDLNHIQNVWGVVKR
jgi:hypothetical protein